VVFVLEGVLLELWRVGYGSSWWGELGLAFRRILGLHNHIGDSRVCYLSDLFVYSGRISGMGWNVTSNAIMGGRPLTSFHPFDPVSWYRFRMIVPSLMTFMVSCPSLNLLVVWPLSSVLWKRERPCIKHELVGNPWKSL
jgi:hypothetical protein